MSYLLAQATVNVAKNICKDTETRDNVNAIGPTVAGLAVGAVNPLAGQATKAVLTASAKSAPNATAEVLTIAGLTVAGTVLPLVVVPVAAAAGAVWCIGKALDAICDWLD